jgi:predicted PurR-regulated permease PerM
VAALFIVLVLTFYMVVEEKKARSYFRNLAPAEYQPYIEHLLQKIQEKIGAWLQGQILLGLIVGCLVFFGLSLLQVKYALLLAIMAGLLEVIPYVGPIVSVIPAAIIAFAQAPVLGIFVLALYIVIQQLENHILVPKIMQKVTGLNPIISIAALLIGMKVGGLAGAILAIPLATLCVVVLEDLFHDAT